MIIRKYITKAGEERIYTYPGRPRKYPNGRDGLLPYSKINRGRCLERDNYTCQICGAGATQNLNIHHKDNDGYHTKGRETNNGLSNLITLCHRCHSKVHYNVIGRTEDILASWNSGQAMQYIANQYGVSRQRIHQIIRKNSPNQYRTFKT